jgi:hypothetical protein
MELDMPPHDKLYYNFITGVRDPKRLYQATMELLNTTGSKTSKEAIDTLINLSKKLTDNAYFSEAKLFNQLASSEYQSSHVV